MFAVLLRVVRARPKPAVGAEAKNGRRRCIPRTALRYSSAETTTGEPRRAATTDVDLPPGGAPLLRGELLPGV